MATMDICDGAGKTQIESAKKENENRSPTKKEEKKPKKRFGTEAWAEEGGYMQAKISKLINKYQNEKELCCSKSSIFSGVSIFINGYTEPSFDVLRQMMIDHGGRFEHYYSVTRVTHIIANNLAWSKQKLFASKKIIRPVWITESVRNARLEPYEKYEVYRTSSIISYLTISSSVTPTTSSIHQSTSELIAPTHSIEETQEGIEERVTAEDRVLRPLWDRNAETYTYMSENARHESMDNKSDNSGPLTSPGSDRHSMKSPSPPIAAPVDVARDMLPADHPDFIEQFYRHSRLHHLSHWRMEFKQLVSDMRSDPNHQLTGREQLLKECTARDNTGSLRKSSQSSTNTQEETDQVFMHIDMDCFFVSVGLRDKPHLQGKPVVVAHAKSENQKDDGSASMSDIASCSYEARKAGVKNGMLLGRARPLCPDLVSIPYDFDGYNEVSGKLYAIIASYTLDIEAVSCDELYVDLTSLLKLTKITASGLCRRIRAEIWNKTACPVSAGIGPNLLLARLATRKGKPNGQYVVTRDDIEEFMIPQKVTDLPGVGRMTNKRLAQLNVTTCEQLQGLNKVSLKHEFGMKSGDQLYNWCRGIDDRQLQPDQLRTSVSCDINYAIRFTQQSQVGKLFLNIAKAVAEKLTKAKMCGSLITLKLKMKHPDAPAHSAKFMGHGIVNNVTKSQSLASATSSSEIIYSECISLWNRLNFPASELRGVGIQVSKLSKQNTCRTNQPTLGFLKKTTITPLKNQHSTNSVSHKSSNTELQSKPLQQSGPPRMFTISDSESDAVCSQNAVVERPLLCGYHEPDDVRNVVKQWISTEKEPLEKDISIILAYLTRLVQYGDLLTVRNVLIHLYYGCRRNQSHPWKRVYLNLCKAVTEVMSKQYEGGCLKILTELDSPD